MSSISSIAFAMLQANDDGASISDIATRLQVPETWVHERIEAARLCLLLTEPVGDEAWDQDLTHERKDFERQRQTWRLH
jgi:hypothetical protein